MKKLKLLLEYKCYPIWIYDEDGELIDNNIVSELINEPSIIKALDEIQHTYDSLFEDNEASFEYKGFENEQKRQRFLNLVRETVSLIEKKLRNIYEIENKIIRSDF